jgi:hypothetical protein
MLFGDEHTGWVTIVRVRQLAAFDERPVQHCHWVILENGIAALNLLDFRVKGLDALGVLINERFFLGVQVPFVSFGARKDVLCGFQLFRALAI